MGRRPEQGDRTDAGAGAPHSFRMSFHSAGAFDLIFALGADITHRMGSQHPSGRKAMTEIEVGTFKQK